MKKNYILLFTLFTSFAFSQDLIITGVFDGPLTGGTPKVIELYASAPIADLSIYGVGSANNGGGTDGEELTLAGSAALGDFIYITTNDAQFTAYFGLTADYVDSMAGINGDDAVELFLNGTVIDVFGDINASGTGEAWEYLDGWAYRMDNTGPDGSTFAISSWTFSGKNAVDGCTTNTTCSSVFPIGTYTKTTNSNDIFKKEAFSIYPNPTNTGSVNIKTTSSEAVSVSVFNILGKQVINTTLSNNTLDVSNLNTGVYILRLSQNGSTTTKKLVIN